MNGIKRSLSRLGPLYDDEKLRKWDVRERLYWDRTYPSTQSLTKPVSAPAASCSINSISPFDQPVVSVSPLSVQVRPRPDCHVYDVIVDVHNRGCMSSSVKADQIEPIRGNDTIHMNSSKEGAKIGTPAIPEQIFATTPQIVTYLHAQDGNALFSSYFKFGLPPKHFPHFTLWLSFVQLLVFVIALCLFGMSSFGPGYNRRIPGRVLMPNLVVDHVCRIEPRSVLLAQRLTDLIRLGARFAPCMRPDPLFTDHVVERQKRWDRA
ncbi:hypothetical protein D915_001935 [Fasciola hepatica]|uniref:Uncharacterized protein n=1 Tax=Fasciola hepatica TaxID=6192 RepID=A0A4E0RWL9_FASHE|nr:hypothetical protein D915_001935 [Fasciola hepatica]